MFAVKLVYNQTVFCLVLCLSLTGSLFFSSESNSNQETTTLVINIPTMALTAIGRIILLRVFIVFKFIIRYTKHSVHCARYKINISGRKNVGEFKIKYSTEKNSWPAKLQNHQLDCLLYKDSRIDMQPGEHFLNGLHHGWRTTEIDVLCMRGNIPREKFLRQVSVSIFSCYFFG